MTPSSTPLVVVIGGGTGMGRDVALDQVSRGRDVLIVGRRVEPLEATKKAASDPARVTVVVADASGADGASTIRDAVANRAVLGIVAAAGGQGGFRRPGDDVAAIEQLADTAESASPELEYGHLSVDTLAAETGARTRRLTPQHTPRGRQFRRHGIDAGMGTTPVHSVRRGRAKDVQTFDPNDGEVIDRWRPYAVAVTDGLPSVSGQFPFRRSITFYRDGIVAQALGVKKTLPYHEISKATRGPLGVRLYWDDGLHRILITSLRGGSYVVSRLMRGGLPSDIADRLR